LLRPHLVDFETSAHGKGLIKPKKRLDAGLCLRDRLQSTLLMLAQNPELGVAHPELDPPGHSFRYCPVVKRFIVVYEPTADGIRIVRLLHGARHLAEELSRDAGDDD